jgi:hypothetical protein
MQQIIEMLGEMKANAKPNQEDLLARKEDKMDDNQAKAAKQE